MSKDTKLFTIAGTSTYRGENTWRFATGSAHTRELVLKRNDHIDIQLFDLPVPMTKNDAIAWLKENKQLEAVPPKTGRGSALKPEQVAAQEAIIATRVAEVEAVKAEVQKDDMDFIKSLGRPS